MRDTTTTLFRQSLRAVPLFILLAVSSLSAQNWQRVAADYHATDIPSGGRIIFVGDYGGILLSNDDGATWTLPYSGTWAHLRAVRFRDALNGIAAGDGGTLLRTSDGGKTWAGLLSPVRSSIRAIDFPVATIGYGLADSGVMIRTDDGGRTWDTLQNRLPGTGTGVRFINEERGILITEEGIIFRTENSGRQWSTVFTDTSLTFSGLAFNASGILGYACAREGVVLKTTNAGVTWQATTPLEPGFIPLCIAFSATGGVYVGGTRAQSTPPAPLTLLNWSNDGGETWQRPTLSIADRDNAALEGVAVRGNRLSLAGNGGTALLSGLSPAPEAQRVISNSLLTGSTTGDAELPLYRVAFSGSDTGIATVHAGPAASGTMFLRTTDGGVSWRYATSGGVRNYLDIFGFPGGEFLAFSDSGGVLYRTTDAGNTWIPQSTAPIEPRVTKSYAGTLVDRRRGYMAGDSLVYRTTDGGQTWQPRFFSGIDIHRQTGSYVSSLSFPTFEEGYAIFHAQQETANSPTLVVKTTDAGETWREVLRREGSTAHYGLYFVSERRGFYSEGRPAEKTGRLFSTTDGGETWDSLPFDDASPLAVKFLNEMNGFVLGYPSLLLRTSDGGRTWSRESLWPPDSDASEAGFTDIALLPDERTVLLTGNGVIARKTYPDKLVSVADERKKEMQVGVLTVMPNPAHERLRVVCRSGGGVGTATAVRLYDLLGREVPGGPVRIGLSGEVEIDVSELSAGAYRIAAEGTNGEILTARSIVIIR